MGEMRCRLCEGAAHEVGGYLRRVNALGVLPPIWECRPSCFAEMTQDESLLAALESDESPPSAAGEG